MTGSRRLQALTRDESLRLLGEVAMGRVVFNHRALPAIRPVNHLLDGQKIIIRCQPGSALARSVGTNGGSVVAYEADLIDPAEHLGWSVIVVGRASRLADAGAAEHYRRTLEPWVTGCLDDIIEIRVEMVDGFRLVPGEEAAPPAR